MPTEYPIPEGIENNLRIAEKIADTGAEVSKGLSGKIVDNFMQDPYRTLLCNELRKKLDATHAKVMTCIELFRSYIAVSRLPDNCIYLMQNLLEYVRELLVLTDSANQLIH